MRAEVRFPLRPETSLTNVANIMPQDTSLARSIKHPFFYQLRFDNGLEDESKSTNLFIYIRYACENQKHRSVYHNGASVSQNF